MNLLSAHVDSYASCVLVSLEDANWHTRANIPPEPGWYFLRTDTPVGVLKQQALWASTYATKRSGKTANIRNYDIAARAGRFSEDLEAYWNIAEVYT